MKTEIQSDKGERELYYAQFNQNRELMDKYRAAMFSLIAAGESHMNAHPDDGAAWHKANADFYKALTAAKATLNA